MKGSAPVMESVVNEICRKADRIVGRRDSEKTVYASLKDGAKNVETNREVP